MLMENNIQLEKVNINDKIEKTMKKLKRKKTEKILKTMKVKLSSDNEKFQSINSIKEKKK